MAEGTSSGMAGWLPAVTAILGFLSSQISEWFKDRRSHEREREARNDARRDRVLERRNEEQRQTLLDLQDALHKLMQAAASAHSQDARVHPSQESWQYNHRHDEITLAHGAAQSKTTMLAVRVRDEYVRTMTESLKIECVLVNQAKSKSQSDASFAKALALFQSVTSRIGVLVRESDEVFLAK